MFFRQYCHNLEFTSFKSYMEIAWTFG